MSFTLGVEETGIFRLPGQNSRVQALKDLYDSGNLINIINDKRLFKADMIKYIVFVQSLTPKCFLYRVSVRCSSFRRCSHCCFTTEVISSRASSTSHTIQPILYSTQSNQM